MISPAQSRWIEAARRLGELQRSAACAVHLEEEPLGDRRNKWFSIYSNWMTGEIFVEVSDDRITRIQAFRSRHKNCPPEERKKTCPWLTWRTPTHWPARCVAPGPACPASV